MRRMVSLAGWMLVLDLPIQIVVAVIAAVAGVTGAFGSAILNYLLGGRRARLAAAIAKVEAMEAARKAEIEHEQDERRARQEREDDARRTQWEKEFDAWREEQAETRHRLTNQLTAAIGQHQLAQADIARIRQDLIAAQREAGHLRDELHLANIKIADLEARVRACEERWNAAQAAGAGGHEG